LLDQIQQKTRIINHQNEKERSHCYTINQSEASVQNCEMQMQSVMVRSSEMSEDNKRLKEKITLRIKEYEVHKCEMARFKPRIMELVNKTVLEFQKCMVAVWAAAVQKKFKLYISITNKIQTLFSSKSMSTSRLSRSFILSSLRSIIFKIISWAFLTLLYLLTATSMSATAVLWSRLRDQITRSSTEFVSTKKQAR